MARLSGTRYPEAVRFEATPSPAVAGPPTVPARAIVDAQAFGLLPDTGENMGPALRSIAQFCRNHAGPAIEIVIAPGVYNVLEFIDTNPSGPSGDYFDAPSGVAYGNESLDIIFHGTLNLRILANDARINIARTPLRTEDYELPAGGVFGTYLRSVETRFVDCKDLEIVGLEMYGSADVTARESSNVVENKSRGLVFGECDGVTLTDLYVHHFCNDGITLGGADISESKTTKYVRLTGCTLVNNARQGLTINMARGVTATECAFDNNGRTGGDYGSHSPRAGCDVEPSFDMSDGFDTDAGACSFVDCTFDGNLGQAFVAGVPDKTSGGIEFTGCTFVKPADALLDQTIGIDCPGVIFSSCTIDESAYGTEANGLLVDSTGTVPTTVILDNCTIRSSGRGITSGPLNTPASFTVSRCVFEGTHNEPATKQFIKLSGTAIVVNDCELTLPAAAHDGVGGHSVTSLAVASCDGNTFRVVGELGAGLYFQTGYDAPSPGCIVSNDYYPHWASFRCFNFEEPDDGYVSGTFTA